MRGVLFVLVLLLAAQVCVGFTVKVVAGEERCFTEDAEEGDYVKFHYDVLDGGRRDVDISVKDPKGEPIYREMRDRVGRFTFHARDPGGYVFCFNNLMSSLTHKTVSFDITKGEKRTRVKVAKDEHVAPVQQGVVQLISGVRQVQSELRYMAARKRVHKESAAQSKSNVLFFAVMEGVVVISMSLWQIYSLRKVFEVRRIV